MDCIESLVLLFLILKAIKAEFGKFGELLERMQKNQRSKFKVRQVGGSTNKNYSEQAQGVAAIA
jgi:predicted sugar kinase